MLSVRDGAGITLMLFWWYWKGVDISDVWEIYWTGEGKDYGKGYCSQDGWSACQGSSWICACCLVGYV